MAIVVKRLRAELDLLEIWDYIADSSLDRADEFLDRIEEKLQALARNTRYGKKARGVTSKDCKAFPLATMWCSIKRLKTELM
ncbi:MAG: type II toxin-antitoxin system RelE/ParE family toxin [Chroococcidiopsidaceae cyanobacterium CP_BM_RX_35]|nr:type II toxin-antitoxin system RelE/ParE family toxin [Chroococcidiopsidaceae cyanobacterium CP_BM_RX_35]